MIGSALDFFCGGCGGPIIPYPGCGWPYSAPGAYPGWGCPYSGPGAYAGWPEVG
jgi:hypothetical protein